MITRFSVSKYILNKQIFFTLVTFLFRFVFSGGKRVNKDYHFFNEFPKSTYFDLFSILNINISSNGSRLYLKKNIGLTTNWEILDSDLWIDDWSGEISEIEDIIIEADRDKIPEYWAVSENWVDELLTDETCELEDEDNLKEARNKELKLLIPRAVFFKMKDGTKFCVAVFYKIKTAQLVVAQMKKEFLSVEAEYYETVTKFVEEIEATKGEFATPVSLRAKRWKFLYPFYNWAIPILFFLLWYFSILLSG